MKLLLAEDEREMANALLAVLKHHNYSVDVVDNGLDAYDWAQAADYDGIILDIMMPGMSGLEVLERLRRRGNMVPVLFLTAKGEVDDKVAGLDLGADDYLTKPFAMKELLARVRALTRRKERLEASVLNFGDLRLDRGTFELECGEQKVRLGNKEYQMMEMLMRNPNTFTSAEQFMERIWGFDTEAEINVIWVYISNLRKKIQRLGSCAGITAARGIGYRLDGENFYD